MVKENTDVVIYYALVVNVNNSVVNVNTAMVNLVHVTLIVLLKI